MTLADALAKIPFTESEESFQNRVVHVARLYGWRVAHFRKAPVAKRNGQRSWSTPIRYDGRGFPDLVLARDGVVLFAELKNEKGYPSREQRAWLAEIGGQARLWRPRDWDSIVEELKRDS